MRKYILEVEACWENLCNIYQNMLILQEKNILKIIKYTNYKYESIDRYIIKYDDKNYKIIKNAINKNKCNKHKDIIWYIINKNEIKNW